MVTITFPDRDTEEWAIGFLLKRFSCRFHRSGEHIVPEAAVGALAKQGIPFTVKGKATHDEKMAPLRSAPASSIQRRSPRSRKIAR
jgi:hypothetical protein